MLFYCFQQIRRFQLLIIIECFLSLMLTLISTWMRDTPSPILNGTWSLNVIQTTDTQWHRHMYPIYSAVGLLVAILGHQQTQWWPILCPVFVHETDTWKVNIFWCVFSWDIIFHVCHRHLPWKAAFHNMTIAKGAVYLAHLPTMEHMSPSGIMISPTPQRITLRHIDNHTLIST